MLFSKTFFYKFKVLACIILYIQLEFKEQIKNLFVKNNIHILLLKIDVPLK